MPLSPEKLAALRAFLAEPTPASSTKTIREQKNEFEKRFGYKTPTADLVARIEAAERIVWLPCGYVLFIRQNTCRNCRTAERCLDVPQLFLQQKRERRDDSNPYLYTPVSSIEHWGLPRREIIRITTSPYCRSCWEAHAVERESSSKEKKGTEDQSTSGVRREVEVYVIQPVGKSVLVDLATPASPQVCTFWDTELKLATSETDFGLSTEEREFLHNNAKEG